MLIGLIVVVLAAGAATTGAGPHAGGKGAKRIPIGLEDMTRIHAEIVLTGAVLLVLLWVLWRSDAPARIQTSGRILLAVMVVQGIIGYTQFFTHLPASWSGIHVFGAAMVWSTVLWFHHGLSDHRPESTDVRAGPVRPDGRPGPQPVPLPVLTARAAAGAGDRVAGAGVSTVGSRQVRDAPGGDRARGDAGAPTSTSRPPPTALAGHRVERPDQSHVVRHLRASRSSSATRRRRPPS